MSDIKFWLLVAAIVILSSVTIGADAGQQAGDFDRNQDGQLDNWEQQEYERETGKLANDLRGGLNLPPPHLRTYNPVINNGDDKIDY